MMFSYHFIVVVYVNRFKFNIKVVLC